MYVIWSYILGYQKIDLTLFDKISNLTDLKKNIDYIKYNKHFNCNILSYEFMYNFKPVFNDKYINLIRLRKLQRFFINILYKPDGLMFNKIKLDFDTLIRKI